MKKYIKNILNGHPFKQEYLCMPEDGIESTAYISFNGTFLDHLFIGYKPAIIATTKKIDRLSFF